MANIEMIQALHGDCFILHCQKGKNKGTVVVDGGPNRNARNIVDKLDTLDKIDLMVVTHYDDDHIGGILKYIAKHKNDSDFPVKKMWVNCAFQVPVPESPNISFNQAYTLASELTDINKRLLSEGKETIEWEDPVVSLESYSLPYAGFTILSPTKDVKSLNDRNYQDSIANISSSHERQEKALNCSLEELAKIDTNIEPKSIQEIINESSIAFLIRTDTFSALMLGDSYPGQIVDSLPKLGYNEDNKLHVDYVKVSHHGSRNNVSNDLLNIIDCNNYLISTNGGNGTSCHPDREAIAKILCHSERNQGETLHLFFNYPLSQIERRGYKFLKEDEELKYNFKLHDDILLL